MEDKGQSLLVVGVDVASDPKNTGIAWGRFDHSGMRVTHTEMGVAAVPLAAHLAAGIGETRRVLLALDAPLGWPMPLTEALHTHVAGEPLPAVPANHLFRRYTDRFIKEKLGKQPLDVGADRIARTAYTALTLLADLRRHLNRRIALAWTPAWRGIGAIEVYPAATLRAHGIHAPGYRAPPGLAVRRQIVDALRRHLDIQTGIPALDQRADALDAVLCLLAAQDFITGHALSPPNRREIRREGWIWARQPDAD